MRLEEGTRHVQEIQVAATDRFHTENGVSRLQWLIREWVESGDQRSGFVVLQARGDIGSGEKWTYVFWRLRSKMN